MNRLVPFRILSLLVVLTSALMISACNQTEPKTAVDTDFKETMSDLTNLQSISLTESNKQIIRETFDSVKVLQDKLQNHPSPTWVVDKEDVKISLSEFVLARINRDLIFALNQVKEIPSDAALLKDMVITQLTANYARQSGVVVTPKEVSEEIEFQKAALDEADPNDDNHRLILYIMENRIRISGKTEEEFWNSAEVYEDYETSLYNSRLIANILSDESTKGMDSYYELQEKLFNDFQKKHSIQAPDFNELLQSAS
ncbi:hypothetical protein SAMN04488688_102398 [Paenibacillus sp. cl141a]|uniref:hypothetical protein n=1 Tax=Paenibacillus sp. cl141a TaxID=1761877 RepID=UPI0008C996CE|nr:hypothetical protein [Paenibacillus sp. cl141a]SEK83237.1 hypothetical protein SAMN04488688_102398 [Paenibacillus sp. cl141a]